MAIDMKLKEIVAQQISSSSQKVFDAVVDVMVTDELKKREELVLSAIKKINELKSESQKTKPDNTAYDIEGKILQQSYTKETLEKLKKNSEKTAKLVKALDAAFEGGDFSQLKNLND